MKHLQEHVARRWIAAGIKRDGKSVGLFFRLPEDLAKQFPSLSPHDDSPSHVTFLVLGDVDPSRAAELKGVLERVVGGFYGTKATLAGLGHFEHADKDRSIAHVKVDFDKDLNGLRHRLKQELAEANFPVDDMWPDFKPHVTLAYMDGVGSRYGDPVPSGAWDLKEVEVWGMPDIQKIPLANSATRVASKWMKSSSVHGRNIALMKWLSEATRALGVGRDTYVVGGAVRNFVIDRPIKDIDIVIDSVAARRDSEWLAKNLASMMPTQANLTTNQYGVAILTVKGDWELEGHNLKGEVLEIANARKESYTDGGGKGHKPTDVQPATIDEDVLRREFTFNTLLWRMMDLAQGPDKAEIIDITGCGLRDLQQGMLKCPREPDVVFSDDPTRMLRAIKFTGKYGFKIPPDLVRSIRKNAPKMKRMPWEAVASILVDNVLNEPTARKSLRQMRDLGLLQVVSEMIQEQKPFAAYMANTLRKNRKVQLLLDLMELGVPAKTPLSFLDPKGQKRLRELTVAMPEDEASQFVDLLLKPPVNNREVIERLGLKGPQRGSILPTARRLILDDPRLAKDGRRLTQEVVRNFPSVSRVATRYALTKISMPLAEGDRLYSDFEKAYAMMLQRIVRAQNQLDGREPDKYLLRALGTWAKPLIDAGYYLSKFIAEHKAIPRSKAKLMEKTMRLFLNARRQPRNIISWYVKHRDGIKLMQESRGWPNKDDQDDLDLKFGVGPFTVHNVIGLEGDKLESTKKTIEAATKFLSKNPIPRASGVLYGPIMVVGKLHAPRILAWYYPSEDTVYMRPHLKLSRGDVHNLIHELGHRYWSRFASRDKISKWLAYDRKLRNADVEVSEEEPESVKKLKNLKVGDPFPLRIKGFIRGNPRVVAIEPFRGDVLYVIETNKGKRGRISLRQYTQDVRSTEKRVKRREGFPTPYASKNPEEHFSEAFAMYAMGQLPAAQRAAFEEVWG